MKKVTFTYDFKVSANKADSPELSASVVGTRFTVTVNYQQLNEFKQTVTLSHQELIRDGVFSGAVTDFHNALMQLRGVSAARRKPDEGMKLLDNVWAQYLVANPKVTTVKQPVLLTYGVNPGGQVHINLVGAVPVPPDLRCGLCYEKVLDGIHSLGDVVEYDQEFHYATSVLVCSEKCRTELRQSAEEIQQWQADFAAASKTVNRQEREYRRMTLR